VASIATTTTWCTTTTDKRPALLLLAGDLLELLVDSLLDGMLATLLLEGGEAGLEEQVLLLGCGCVSTVSSPA
jgi:hypothetical protein